MSDEPLKPDKVTMGQIVADLERATHFTGAAHTQQRNYGGAIEFGNSLGTLLPTPNPFNAFREVVRVTEPWDHGQEWECVVSPLRLAHPDRTLVQNPDLVGRATWGVGGASHSIDFDIGTGVRFSLAAATVSLAAMVTTPAASVEHVQIAGTICKSRGVLKNVLYRTVDYGSIAAGGNATLPIPQFADAFLLEMTTTTQVLWIVSQRNFDAVNLQIDNYANSSARNLSDYRMWSPLVTGATTLRILSGNAGPAVARVVWRLRV